MNRDVGNVGNTCADPDWGAGQGVRPPPPGKSQKYRVSEQYLSGSPEKITKLPTQHSMLGHHRHASETPYKWRFAGGPMMSRLQWYLDPTSPRQLKNRCQMCTPSDKPFWIRACYIKVNIRVCSFRLKNDN